MDTDIKYIEEHYLEFQDICIQANISSQELDGLIDKNLIPKPSYTIEVTTIVTSPLDDSKKITALKQYFPKSTIALIKQNATKQNPDTFKNDIKKDFIETFLSHDDNLYAYGNILASDGSIDDSKLEEEFEKEWKYYLQGIYGICTLNNTGKEIAKKEIAVKKIIDFISIHNGKILSDSEKETLLQLNDQYNEVSNLFAPYQRKSSSRGKYLDQLLKKHQLDELIKKYDS